MDPPLSRGSMSRSDGSGSGVEVGRLGALVSFQDESHLSPVQVAVAGLVKVLLCGIEGQLTGGLWCSLGGKTLIAY